VQDNVGVQILQQQDKVTFLYLHDHAVRHVLLNASHSPDVIPSWQGHSIGHYEGDTLVIDTVGVKTWPLSMVDLFGTPHSEALHVIERYRLIPGEAARDAHGRHMRTYINPNGDISKLPFEAISPFYGRAPLDPDTTKNGLQVEITVEDPAVFTTRWSGLVTYLPVTENFWPEMVCAEGVRPAFGLDLAVPTADAPDF
jgi:hypothetical protein